jgi:hypothetical protein
VNLEILQPLIAASEDFSNFGRIEDDDCEQFLNETGEWKGMNFDFLLLDYNQNDYRCIERYYNNDEINERILYFFEVESCLAGEEPSTPSSTTDDESNEEPTDHTVVTSSTSSPPRNLRTFDFMYLYILLGIPFVMLAAVWFWKRADIKYFFAIFKNSIILSLDKDDKKSLMMTNRKRKSNATDNFTYDVFVSYSDKDR